MDPLSVAASIAGLLTAAREVAKILGPFVSAAGKTPQIAFKVHSEVQNTSNILIQLENLIKNAEKSSPKSISLLTVDQLTAVLTGGVLIFSELESASKELLQVMTAPSSRVLQLRCRLQWAHNEDVFVPLLERLEAFKSSLTAMLNIWLCGSVDRAEQRHMELLASLDTLIKNNEALSQRLEALEDSDCRTIVTQRTALKTLRSASTITEHIGKDPFGEGSSATTESHEMRFAQIATNDRVFAFDFEPDLEASWVYSRVKRDTMDFSCRTSTAPSHGWSMLSGLSVSKISKISVIALPVYSEDLTNADHYEFGNRKSTAQLAYTHVEFDQQKLMSHTCAGIKGQLMQMTGFSLLFHGAKNDDAVDSDPTGQLKHIFQLGFPLLMLLRYWIGDFDVSFFLGKAGDSDDEKNRLARLAIREFLSRCAILLKTDPRDLFTVEDLLSENCLGFAKVVTVVELLISKIQNPWIDLSHHAQSQSSLQRSRIGGTQGQDNLVEKLILDERAHLLQLEHFLEHRAGLQRAEVLSAERAAETFGPVELLIDYHFALLLDLEATLSRPVEN